jgi:xylulokinase
MVSLVNGGSALTWVLQLLGLDRQSTPEIDQLLQSVPPGSQGVRCWPFLTLSSGSGAASGAKGCLAGLQLSHGRAHVVRAVIEGLAFELSRHLECLKAAGIPLQRLLLSGGATASRVTPQLLADATGLPLACSTAMEGSLLGAAIVGRGLVETSRSLADLAGDMVPPGREIAPGKNAATYRVQYQAYTRGLQLLPGTAEAVTPQIAEL